MKIRSGSPTRARASIARCRSPCEQSTKRRCARCGRPTRSSSPAARSWACSSWSSGRGRTVPLSPVSTTSRRDRTRGIRPVVTASTAPIRVRSARRSTFPSRAPRTHARPRDGWRTAPASESSDDFPDPFGPSTAQCSPAPIRRVTERSKATRRSPAGTQRSTSSKATAASVGGRRSGSGRRSVPGKPPGSGRKDVRFLESKGGAAISRAAGRSRRTSDGAWRPPARSGAAGPSR